MVSGPANVISTNTGDSTTQACCNSCAANPLCLATTFFGKFQAGQQCSIIISTDMTCSPGEYDLTADYGSGNGPDGGYIISNGNCGAYEFSDDGADD